MKIQINRWSLKKASVFLAVIGLSLLASVSFAQVTVTNSNLANGPYTTLKGAFDALNAHTQSGSPLVTIFASTAEGLLTATLTQPSASSGGSLTIKPSGAIIVTGPTAPGQPLIDLSGAHNVRIDGLSTPGNSLTISNTTVATTAGTSTIRFINDATNNTVTNCTILGSSTSSIGTAAGTILFSTGLLTGNDDNMVSNCNIGPAIGPAGPRPPSKAIMGSGTSAAIENDRASITGNNIFDFFIPTTRLSGISILTGNDGWIISNNRFYQTTPRAFTVAVGSYAAITLNNSTGSFTVSGNIIGFGTNTGTGTTTITGLSNEFRGIDALRVSTTVATKIQYNTISGIRQTTTRNDIDFPAFIGIGMGTINFGDHAGGLIHATGNTIGSLDGTLDGFLPSTIVVDSASTKPKTATVRGFSNFTDQDTTISNNIIGAVTIQGTGTTAGTVGFYGIFVNPNFNTNATISNNVIGGTLPGGAIVDTHTGNYAMVGILCQRAHAKPISGNMVSHIISHANGPGTTLAGITHGGSAGASTLSENTIHSLSNPSGAAGNTIVGMSLSFTGSGNLVARNFVHSLSMTSATGALVGISANSPAGNTKTAYVNNMVRLGIDAGGKPVSHGLTVLGLRERDSDPTQPTNARNTFYFNSVYLGGEGSGGANSYAFISERVFTPGSALRNNIFWNERSHTGPGKNYAIAIARTGGLTSNFNDLRANSALVVGGYTGLVINPPQDLRTLPLWRMVTGQDMNSIDLDPLFQFPDDPAATVDLHVEPDTPVQAMAMPSTIANDFDNDPRPAPPLRADIGADEVTCTTTTTFSNPLAITILDDANATPYPSNISVAGLGRISGRPGSVQVTINDFSHSSPNDVGIVLVAPPGSPGTGALLVQDGAGEDPDMVNVTYALSDTGLSVLPDLTAWSGGTYKPTSYYTDDSFPLPGPLTAYDNPGPAGMAATFASVFGGRNPNGDWTLYVRDFARSGAGTIAGGWSLTITTDVGCGSLTPPATPIPTAGDTHRDTGGNRDPGDDRNRNSDAIEADDQPLDPGASPDR
jgi:subtilisin-like proprotein convertase family protein